MFAPITDMDKALIRAQAEFPGKKIILYPKQDVDVENKILHTMDWDDNEALYYNFEEYEFSPPLDISDCIVIENYWHDRTLVVS